MTVQYFQPDALVLDHGIAHGAVIAVEAGRVLGIGREVPAANRAQPIEGTLLPGAIDLQVNGAGGRSVDEADAGALEAVSQAVGNGGAAAFLPTLVTAPWDELLDKVAAVARWIRSRSAGTPGAVPLGIHVEGPFLEEPGAHDADLFVDPTPARVDALVDAGQGALAMVTLAPARPGAAAATARLVEAGVAVSLGHARSVQGFSACVQAGASLVTHLFNAMGPLHHRRPGIAGLALDHGALACALIADGVHVDPTMVRVAFAALGPRRTLLVSDAMPAAGLGDGAYRFGSIEATVQDGIARDREGNLAGSMLTMGQAMRNFTAFVPKAGAWTLAQIAAVGPARILGADDGWGRIRTGVRPRFTRMRGDRIDALDLG